MGLQAAVHLGHMPWALTKADEEEEQEDEEEEDEEEDEEEEEEEEDRSIPVLHYGE
jgi:ribosomal protein L12E/L44/L45/RPP1/RPP2